MVVPSATVAMIAAPSAACLWRGVCGMSLPSVRCDSVTNALLSLPGCAFSVEVDSCEAASAAGQQLRKIVERVASPHREGPREADGGRNSGGRNRDRTYDLCDVNVRLTGLEIGLRSRVRGRTSILPQQQLFRLRGRAWRRLVAGRIGWCDHRLHGRIAELSWPWDALDRSVWDPRSARAFPDVDESRRRDRRGDRCCSRHA